MIQQEAPSGSQDHVYFCPHEGLLFDLVNGRYGHVIGRDGKYTLSLSQYKMLRLLIKKQMNGISSGWCTINELEACLRPLYKTVITKIVRVDGKERKYKERRKKPRTEKKKLEAVQNAVSALRSAIREVHSPCDDESLIEFGIYDDLVVYRLSALSSCPVSPDCCSLVLKLPG